MHVKMRIEAKYTLAHTQEVTASPQAKDNLVLLHNTGAEMCLNGTVVGYCSRSGHVKVKLDNGKVVTYSNFIEG